MSLHGELAPVGMERKFKSCPEGHSTEEEERLIASER